MKYIFGPVPSRRLGFSLGVDIIPYKTCTYDCIYCELGKTACQTIEPSSTIPAEAVLKELQEWLSADSAIIDHVTLSGSGEPTLHPDLGQLIKEIKKISPVPVALITNGSLLYKKEVLEQVLEADIVLPSLDAADPDSFQRINRPHPSLRFDQLLDGLLNLGRLKESGLWLETLFLEGMNDTPDQVDRLLEIIHRIKPEKVQLNTVVRPPVESSARPVDFSRLKEIQKKLGPQAEIISGGGREGFPSGGSLVESEIQAMVCRRPCTAEDIARCLSLSLEETFHLLKGLIRARKVTYESFNRQGFYRGL